MARPRKDKMFDDFTVENTARYAVKDNQGIAWHVWKKFDPHTKPYWECVYIAATQEEGIGYAFVDARMGQGIISKIEDIAALDVGGNIVLFNN